MQEVYAEHKSKVLLDNLNMLYVALTRPKTRLYIQTSNKGGNLNVHFDDYLKAEGMWEEDKKVYTFGTAVKNKAKKRVENKYIKVVEPIDKLSRILKITRQAPKMWEVDNPEKGADKGRKVHEILSYILVKEDLDSALEKALREGLIVNTELAELRSLLERVLKHKDLQVYFTEGLKVKNEEDILLANGKVMRPDRLVFHNKGVTIIDYKTGDPLADHEEQILAYGAQIKQMGYAVNKCVLAYINEDSIVLKDVL